MMHSCLRAKTYKFIILPFQLWKIKKKTISNQEHLRIVAFAHLVQVPSFRGHQRLCSQRSEKTLFLWPDGGTIPGCHTEHVVIIISIITNNLNCIKQLIEKLWHTSCLHGEIYKFIVSPFKHHARYRKSLCNLTSSRSWHHVYQNGHESNKPSRRSMLKWKHNFNEIMKNCTKSKIPNFLLGIANAICSTSGNLHAYQFGTCTWNYMLGRTLSDTWWCYRVTGPHLGLSLWVSVPSIDGCAKFQSFHPKKWLITEEKNKGIKTIKPNRSIRVLPNKQIN